MFFVHLCIVCELFHASRAAGFQIHYLRLWALHKVHKIGLSTNSFQAFDTWILNFKRKNNIVSRKVTKFVTV